MAQEPVSIPKHPALTEGLDYRFLKRTGIEIAQELAGDIWTDYNEHDPGITILEQLCFSITEMAYKAGMSIEDLLYAYREQPFDSKDNAFFTPDKAFPCNPLTVIDYRRLLVDRLYPQLKNAWLVPLDRGAFGVNMSGLYEVSLMLNENTAEAGARAREDAHRMLNQFRNIGEDFENVRVLRPLKLAVRADLGIDPKALAENVLADVLYTISLAISPPVRFQSREELEEEGMSVEDIFNGPVPMHGFVNIDSLMASGKEPVWTMVNPTRIINLIREVEGIERVSQLEIGIYIDSMALPKGFELIEKFKGDEEHDGYYITTNIEKLPRGHKVKVIKKPRRDLPEGFYIVREDDAIPDGFYMELDINNILEMGMFRVAVEGLEYEYDTENVRKSLERKQAEQLIQFQHRLQYPDHSPRSRRNVKELSYYFSIQNSFPEIYGIGEYGVRKDRPRDWHMHARHLKAYLFFFEQVLADYLAQLTNFYQLFSLRDQIKRTYFHQIPQIPNKHLVVREDQDDDELQGAVDQIGLGFDPISDRRNRALDHLLARFGEEFLSESYNALMRNAIEEGPERFEDELIKAKLRFMKNVIELGRERGRGLDYLAYAGGAGPSDSVTHTSALQKRLAMLFNMKDNQHVSISESLRTTDGLAFNKRSKPKDGQSAFTFSAKHQDVLSAVMKDGLNRDNFVIQEHKKRADTHQVFFTAMTGRGSDDAIYTSTSPEKCEAAITALIKRLRDLNAGSEGFHLLEHVLLRPVGNVMHTWYLVQEGRIFLETPVMEREHFADEFRKALIRRGDDPENYLTTGNSDEGYTLVLTDEDGSIIAYKDGYIDENSAERERDRIILLLPQMDDKDSGIIIRKEQHIPKGALLADDFYSLRLSVILPSWPVRFTNDKFRALFEQVVKLNVPAHADVNCYWVDLAEMTDFEKVYLEWRTEKSEARPNQPWLDELSWCLVILLKYFEDPNDDLVIKELPGLRDKHGLSMRFGDEGS